ncbi:hypothetical protein AYO44_03795 [Planctomycetaceae bacterium SCGC AG-212-F19]|nr:hypothetical protein AYO44_03795 [Planctomycetaceae bacterium SCGC AG-212-F19]
MGMFTKASAPTTPAAKPEARPTDEHLAARVVELEAEVEKLKPRQLTAEELEQRERAEIAKWSWDDHRRSSTVSPVILKPDLSKDIPELAVPRIQSNYVQYGTHESGGTVITGDAEAELKHVKGWPTCRCTHCAAGR